jgi:NADH dehydrogenase
MLHEVAAGELHPGDIVNPLRRILRHVKVVEAAVLGRPPKPFVFATLGQLATTGHRTGVARVWGVKFSGLVAWGLWRAVYLTKLPRLPKKLRVMMGWMLDLLFGREIEQLLTLRDVEALSDRLARTRARAKQSVSIAAAPKPDASL